MKKENPNTKKVEIILAVCSILFTALYFGSVFLLHKLTGWQIEMCYIGLLPLLLLGMYVMLKALTSSRLKGSLEQFEKDEREKEEAGMGKDEKPKMGILFIIGTLIALIWSAGYGIEMAGNMINAGSFGQYLPEFACFITMFTCSILIAWIAYNVWRLKIFSKTNVNLVYAISGILFTSAFLQGRYLGATPMLPNETVLTVYMFFSLILLFFAEIFEVAIKVRKDQDLIV